MPTALCVWDMGDVCARVCVFVYVMCVYVCVMCMYVWFMLYRALCRLEVVRVAVQNTARFLAALLLVSECSLQLISRFKFISY